MLRGCTAMHYAASEGHVQCLQLMLKVGGRYDGKNNENKTPLDVATGECREILQKLSE